MENQTFNRFKDFIIAVMDAEREVLEQDVEMALQNQTDFEFAEAA